MRTAARRGATGRHGTVRGVGAARMRGSARIPAHLKEGALAGSRRDDWRRFVQVVRTLVKWFAPRPWPRRGGRRGVPSMGERLRTVFEELGLTYLKLGQFLAMRFDVLPPDICRELDKLFEAVPPVPYDDVERVVAAELGGRISDHFAWFDPEPIASASVAQVHEALTTDGEYVAVKIQRPGIERVFGADMRNLWRVARAVDRLRLLGGLSAQEVAEEFIAWTARELDFVTEAHTAQRLRASALPFEVVPRMVPALSGRRVLTMEFIDGMSLREVTQLIEAGQEEELRARLPGVDLHQTMHWLARACLRQLFIHGFFHGDPHPGNILVRRDGKVAFVDFGIFGELTPFHRGRLFSMIEAIAVGDIDEAFWCYVDMADPTPSTDFAAFQRAARAVLQRWYLASIDEATPLADRHVGKYAGEMMDLVRRHRLRAGFDTLLFWRALHALDAATLKMPDHIDLLAELRTFFRSARGGPVRQLREIATDPLRLARIAQLRREAPDHARSVSDALSGRISWPIVQREPVREARAKTWQVRMVSAATIFCSVAILQSAKGAQWPILALMVVFLLMWALASQQVAG